MKVPAEEIIDYKIIRGNALIPIYPFVRNNKGVISIEVLSPLHGRSFLLKKVDNFHWIIGKGNGLSYSSHSSLITSPHDSDTWGRLSIQQALRDYEIGNEIANLGIRTNRMEYVLGLPFEVIFNGKKDKAALLQYAVECPYRIVDFAFIPKPLLYAHVSNWKPVGNMRTNAKKHIIAADILFYNLSLLHTNNILHNAITPQNYTWALELVDFEASHTPKVPFGTRSYQSYIPMLRDMEIIQTYEIVNYIAWCLKEKPEYNKIENVIHNYGFRLNQPL